MTANRLRRRCGGSEMPGVVVKMRDLTIGISVKSPRVLHVLFLVEHTVRQLSRNFLRGYYYPEHGGSSRRRNFSTIIQNRT